MTILLWHRRDLRLHDHAALYQASTQSSTEGKPLLPLFILDPGILNAEDTASVRIDFLLASLQRLREDYRTLGGDLWIRQGDPLTVLQALVKQAGIQEIHWNDDVEPYSRQRDQAIEDALQSLGIKVTIHQDQMLHGPGSVLTQSNQPYSVYTPFWRNWNSQKKLKPFPAPKTIHVPKSGVETGTIPTLKELGLSSSIPLPPLGEKAALEQLHKFCVQTISHYDEQRNFPGNTGTSQLSTYLKFGILGIREVWEATEKAWQQKEAMGIVGITTWRQELCWREFYKHVLFHFPRVAHENYLTQYNGFVWDENKEHFGQWCAGETGYPIVDAAMRQLNETGWMHNRSRMIVASFLTKDLLIPWQWGERYFMQKLLDGDQSANNGGWQWSASMGTDPKPLRIFNPVTQANKFDPQTTYIRRWVPELEKAKTVEILSNKNLEVYGYPKPMVDHALQQRLYKERYKAAKS
jgi:deoxyribodipyrimidine photo-lyase